MIGIDEVGRGAWAGPLLVCAARLYQPIPGLRDSKKLSVKKRTFFVAEINKFASIGFGWVLASEIDELGLSAALRLGAARALAELSPRRDEHIVIDGSVNFAPEYLHVKTVVKADDLYPVVSAASIAAKVARDKHMHDLAKLYPDYGFERHVGYGTKFHIQQIKLHGLSKEHRHSFRLPTKA